MVPPSFGLTGLLYHKHDKHAIARLGHNEAISRKRMARKMQSGGQGNQKKKEGRALPINRQVILGAATLVAAALLLIIGLYPRNAVAPEVNNVPPPENAANEAGTQPSRVESGCELVQQLSYSRCGHNVDRRTPIPQELVGKTLNDVAAAYEGWQVTEFLPKRITMARLYPLYCAQHEVLMPDESGVLGIFENKYGDAMVFVRSLETSLDSLPESIQEEVRMGKGFDTMADLEQWLENVES
jgi:hypothetical protein